MKEILSKRKLLIVKKNIVLLVYDVCTTIWKYNCNSNASLYGVTIIEDSLGIMIIKI